MPFILLMMLVLPADALPHFKRHPLPPTKVSEELFRGGRPTEQSLRELKDLGIRTIINLQGGDLDNRLLRPIVRRWEPGELPEAIQQERELTEALGMNYIHIPVNSLRRFSAEQSCLVESALEVLKRPDAVPAFVHCQFGRDRTGLFVALYRVNQDGMTVAEAQQEWAINGHRGIGKVVTYALDDYFRRWVNRRACEADLGADIVR
jgi:protein tyrosine/serine phosphatase